MYLVTVLAGMNTSPSSQYGAYGLPSMYLTTYSKYKYK